MTRGRILLVDDYQDSLLMWATYLRMLGFDVETAVDGESALRAALSSPPDVVVLDLVLPGINGCEVAARLRREPSTAHVPIIATTGLTHRAFLDQVRSVGFFSITVKPCDPPALVREVERALAADRDNRDATAGESLAPRSG